MLRKVVSSGCARQEGASGLCSKAISRLMPTIRKAHTEKKVVTLHSLDGGPREFEYDPWCSRNADVNRQEAKTCKSISGSRSSCTQGPAPRAEPGILECLWPCSALLIAAQASSGV
jgi:hypothetical protein